MNGTGGDTMRTIPTTSSATAMRRHEHGQSTVEYVGLAVAVAVLLVAIGGGMGGHGDKLGGAVAKRLQEAIGATR
jgi:Flp pilus assembly pilin Flp